MTKVLGATSTADDVLSGIDLHGKRILVTGVSAAVHPGGIQTELGRHMDAASFKR